MNIFAHLALGLIIGKLTGQYVPALLGSLLVDLDHFIVYSKNRVILNLRKLIKILTSEEDPYKGQRGYFHNIFVWLILGSVISLINLKFGAIFFLGYFSHLFLDTIDSADFYPFYSSKINIRGFVPYFSKIEFVITVILFLAYFIMVLAI